ncbi:hypothetical protein [Puerhibacterium sp. TATVAM-FAB25]|uniref:hypothetical protein n=1 Tax=Puerhibacterium sp. TATVAM-FAB25 TaxID=3093699 RepID=UPI003979465B
MALGGGGSGGEAGATLVADAVGLLRRALDDAAAARADAGRAHAVDWESTAADRFRRALEESLGRLRDDVAALAVATGAPW